jgi:hypothetical protein
MFDWNEIVLIGVVALIVIGPKELPARRKKSGFSGSATIPCAASISIASTP